MQLSNAWLVLRRASGGCSRPGRRRNPIRVPAASCFATSVALPDDLDALYGLPLDEFTQARNDLARRLRAERKPEDAAEVSALRKPSAAAWVVNQLVRGRRDDVRALLAAADEIRAGAEDGDARFREAVDRLARGAREILTASGRTSTDQVIQEVVTTLRAIAATEPEALETGRLTQAPRGERVRRARGRRTDARSSPSREAAPREGRGAAAIGRPRGGRRGTQGARRRPHRGSRAPTSGRCGGARGRTRTRGARARRDARRDGQGRARRCTWSRDGLGRCVQRFRAER